MAIHKTDYGDYVIASYRVWRPGVYDTERAAKYAFRFSDEVLERLQDEVGRENKITFEILQAEARAQKAKLTALAQSNNSRPVPKSPLHTGQPQR